MVVWMCRKINNSQHQLGCLCFYYSAKLVTEKKKNLPKLHRTVALLWSCFLLIEIPGLPLSQLCFVFHPVQGMSQKMQDVFLRLLPFLNVFLFFAPCHSY